MSGLEYFGRVCRRFGYVALIIAGFHLLPFIIYANDEDQGRFEHILKVGVFRDSEIRSEISADALVFVDNWVLRLEISLALSVILLILGYAAKDK